MNIEEIKDLIKLVSKSGIGKVEIESEGFKVVIKGGATSSNEPIYVQAPQPIAHWCHSHRPACPSAQELAHNRYEY